MDKKMDGKDPEEVGWGERMWSEYIVKKNVSK